MIKIKEVEMRYSKIKTKFPRELILLQGTGCFWKKCKFCDYFHDVSEKIAEVNLPVIEKVTGEFKVLDVINSGSAMELDSETLNAIIHKVKEKNIKELWFEAHWDYRNKLKAFAAKFKEVEVNFRTGVETFNSDLRNSWNKGIPESVTPEEISKYFKSVCLLVGLPEQSLEDVIKDIEIAKKYFKKFVLSIFIKNSTNIIPNKKLIFQFKKELYPKIVDDPSVEILINNTDLGVG